MRSCMRPMRSSGDRILDAEERRLGQDRLIRLRAEHCADIRYAKSGRGHLHVRLLDYEDIPETASFVQVK